MSTRSIEAEAAALLETLTYDNRAFSARFGGAPDHRQPVHTVYGGAHLFRSDLASRMGLRALESLEAHAPDAESFAEVIGLSTKKGLADKVYERVRHKLELEPVEDYRIDFEDGFGVRPDEEEDAVALVAAEQVARGLEAKSLPPSIGIRVKPLDEDLKQRSARTLDLFLTALASRTGGALPDPFVVTLPKVRGPEQVRVMAALLDLLEVKLALPAKHLRLELMIELPQTLFDVEGRLQLPRLLDAGDGRVAGAHFGTYDYTAAVDVTATHQTMDHAACRLALGLMKIGYAGTPVFVSDGATTLLPVPLYKGEGLKKKQRQKNRDAVHAAWRASYANIRRALENGIYQGWDLHPAQLPVRYAATHAFFLEGFEDAAVRLTHFIRQAARATTVGHVFDDAATGQGLLNYFLRAHNAGAVTLEELEQTGLSRAEIATRSFLKILDGRR
ncbi:MAG: phosphoenolpyruvate kinase [Myxococcales bacterium]|nr:phosphoenolpyruvate kinase [Myxococcales bacterium]